MIEGLLAELSFGKALLGLLGLYLAFFWLSKYQNAKRISRLGARAPEMKAYLPFAVDFIYKYMKASSERRDNEFWNEQMANAHGASELTLTAELNSGAGSRELYTIDAENIKAILSSQFADYGKGKKFHEDWQQFIGDSVFGTDGAPWVHARQVLRPMFSKERMVDLDVFERHVQKLIILLGGKESSELDGSVDIFPIFLRYTLDAATDYLLGEGTNTLDIPGTRVAEAFRYVLMRQSEIFRMDEFSFLISRKKFGQELAIMEDFIQPYIQKSLSLSSAQLEEKLSKKDTFLDSLARATRDAKFIRDQLITILLAGRDTTAATLSFCLFELGRNPDVVTTLREELEARLGLGKAGRRPTYDDLKDMKYLNAVLNETMRVYPVVPINFRYSLHDTTLPRGGGPDGSLPLGVLANTRILYSTMNLQKRAELYPSPGSPNYLDPQKWIPRRWLDWQPKTWEFIPFHHGKRACIGQQFAVIEMAYTVARIFQMFEGIEAVPRPGMDKVVDPTVRVEVTMSPDHPLGCRFFKAKE